MKKALFFLGVALALAACSKTVTVVDEAPNAITINAVSSVPTRGAELVGAKFPEALPIVVGASTAEQPNFLADPGQKFAWNGTTDSGIWWAVDASDAHKAVFWPIGGKTVDFLAYAVNPADADIPTPTFDSEKAAKKFTVSGWDTYNKQADFLYAVAHNQKNQKTGVPMVFNHTQALIIFNVRYISGDATDFAISEVKFEEKFTTGTLEVNNEYTKPIVTWTTSGTAADLVMPSGTDGDVASEIKSPVAANETSEIVNYGTPLTKGATFKQLGETLLVIPQTASNPIVTYTLGGKTYEYEVNAIRLNWEAGKAYIYDLSFSNNEILLAPSVVDWTVVDASDGTEVTPAP